MCSCMYSLFIYQYYNSFLNSSCLPREFRFKQKIYILKKKKIHLSVVPSQILWWSVGQPNRPPTANWMTTSRGPSTSTALRHLEASFRPTARTSSAATCRSTGGVTRLCPEPSRWQIICLSNQDLVIKTLRYFLPQVFAFKADCTNSFTKLTKTSLNLSPSSRWFPWATTCQMEWLSQWWLATTTTAAPSYVTPQQPWSKDTPALMTSAS